MSGNDCNFFKWTGYAWTSKCITRHLSPFLNIENTRIEYEHHSDKLKTSSKIISYGDYCFYLFNKLNDSGLKYVLKIKNSTKDGIGKILQYDVITRKFNEKIQASKTGTLTCYPAGNVLNIFMIDFNNKTKTELKKYPESSFVSKSSKDGNVYYDNVFLLNRSYLDTSFNACYGLPVPPLHNVFLNG